MKRCPVCKIAILLGGLGALNWLLLAVLKVDLVADVLGHATILSKVTYVVIGLAGIILLASLFKPCPCSKS